MNPICGHVYLPERTNARGETFDPIICSARAVDIGGHPIFHAGKHRTTLGGLRLRWDNSEQVSA